MRSTKVLIPGGAKAAGTYNFDMEPPRYAERAILHILATTGLTTTVDAKVQQGNPDRAQGFVDTTVIADQVAASQTNAGRYAAWGHVTAASGTSWDAFAVPVSGYQRVVVTVTGANCTALKVWVEYLS